MTYSLILDCSHYQPVLDVAALKAAGVVGLVHKATEELAQTEPRDSTYLRHKAACLAGGLLWGAYCFEDGISGIEQADFYLNFVKPDGQTLLALDLEKWATLEEAEQFVLRVHERTGIWCWLYTGVYYVLAIRASQSKVLGNCRLWISAPNALVPPIPLPWTAWSMWQYGYLNFSNETFDANRWNGTLDELKVAWKEASGIMTMPLTDAKVISLNELETHQGPGLKTPVNGVATIGATYPVNTSNAKDDADNPGTIMYEIMPEHWLNGKYLQFADNTNPTPPPLPVPIPVNKITTAVLNLRSAPVVDNPDVKKSKNLIAQIPSGETVQVTGPALTTTNHFILTSWHDTKTGNIFSGWASADYMKDAPANPR